jgi:hypothetical protein
MLATHESELVQVGNMFAFPRVSNHVLPFADNRISKCDVASVRKLVESAIHLE